MNSRPYNRLFSRRKTLELIGRDVEVNRLREVAASGSPVAVLGQPWSGTSELLRETFDRLFYEAGEIIPFYFQLSAYEISPRELCSRFAREFLSQFLAFDRRSADLVISGASPEELREGLTAELSWVPHRSQDLDLNAWDAQTCYSLPVRASAAGHRPFLILDDLHHAGSTPFLSEFKERYSAAGIPFVIAGYRRSIYPAASELQRMHIEALSVEEGSELVRLLSAEEQVSVTEECADLIAVQLGGRPGYINCLIQTASQLGLALDSFHNVEQVYSQSLMGGSIGQHLDTVLATVRNPGATRLLSVLYANGVTGLRPPALDELAPDQLSRLHTAELANHHTGALWPMSEDLVLNDHFGVSSASPRSEQSRAAIYGQAVTKYVARAPQLMARHYRRRSSLPLKEMIARFDGREVPLARLDFARSRAVSAAVSEEDKIKLPYITFAAHTSAMYPEIGQLLDPERCVVGTGFTDRTGRQPIAWIAAEIESKLEADRETTEFWCDRLKMAALHCGISDYRIWLIAPEGFGSDAADLLASRNAIGSSRAQAQQMLEVLSLAPRPPQPTGYEITIPADGNSELIGAKTLEEIAQRLGFPSKAINQMKTALVEACINASEHSLSPDGKIHIEFAEDAGRLVITVANRGVRLADKTPANASSTSQRRGWGLKLIQGLMDEVSSEYTDDGTILRMAKALPQS